MQIALIGRLVDRFGEGRVAIAGLVCAFTAYGGVGFATAAPALIAFVVLWSLGAR